jgi:hypothetical protein
VRRGQGGGGAGFEARVAGQLIREARAQRGGEDGEEGGSRGAEQGWCGRRG